MHNGSVGPSSLRKSSYTAEAAHTSATAPAATPAQRGGDTPHDAFEHTVVSPPALVQSASDGDRAGALPGSPAVISESARVSMQHGGASPEPFGGPVSFAAAGSPERHSMPVQAQSPVSPIAHLAASSTSNGAKAAQATAAGTTPPATAGSLQRGAAAASGSNASDESPDTFGGFMLMGPTRCVLIDIAVPCCRGAWLLKPASLTFGIVRVVQS